jgi:hypothetical protein
MTIETTVAAIESARAPDIQFWKKCAIVAATSEDSSATYCVRTNLLKYRAKLEG